MTAALARGDIADRNAGGRRPNGYRSNTWVGHRDTELPGHECSSELGDDEYRSPVGEHSDTCAANAFVNVNGGTAQNPIAVRATFEGLLRRSSIFDAINLESR
ncbi:hypothetical protein F3087_21970 [Nocardia colli]|uniref:Uncharacterized protein n=1 Tax=Nocardia colli TaxID=2545717 RepID=A0A5N0EFL1_9NOCA|nr:hypothetical protein [Nocardia colli]KAA8886885.1 hypothetical protein F3087_21970 [Nocardia colli]